MSLILAIDPGPKQSAYVVCEDKRFKAGAFIPNDDINVALNICRGGILAIEMIACYGMPVGAETFDTCRWIGKFEERWQGEGQVQLVYRKDVKMHLCHSMRAKDANIRQALIDKLGPVGTKKNPGPLYGVSGHLWAALAVAIYAAENPTT